MNKISFSLLEKQIFDFNCGNDDLNDFFLNDALLFQNNLLAKTFIWYTNDKIIALASVLNDNIKLSWNKKKRIFKNQDKWFEFYPAVKIGRLGVSKPFQGQGFGNEIIKALKTFFIVKNKTGCRFLTVDAYNNPRVLKFYKNNGFSLLTEMDKDKKTRIMFYDLIQDFNILQENKQYKQEVSNMLSEMNY